MHILAKSSYKKRGFQSTLTLTTYNSFGRREDTPKKRDMAQTVNNVPLDMHSTLRIPFTELATHPRLEELVALINLAFVTSWHTIDGLVGDDRQRYDTSEDMVKEMGLVGAFYIILDVNDKMVAAAGYKPWNEVWKTQERLVKANGSALDVQSKTTLQKELAEDIDDGVEKQSVNGIDIPVEEWEVVAVVVDPSRQGQGLGKRVWKVIEADLAERTRSQGAKRVDLLIRTSKELNEEIWKRNGYHEIAEDFFPPGSFGSRTGFIILRMKKELYV